LLTTLSNFSGNRGEEQRYHAVRRVSSRTSYDDDPEFGENDLEDHVESSEADYLSNP
jgi:hypothetical protein